MIKSFDFQTQGGKLIKMTLASHEISANVHDYSNAELNKMVDKNIALARFRSAWAICEVKVKVRLSEEVCTWP